ncbi:terminal protein TpgA1 [Streptomyces sp. NBC_01221]|uniref:telomere-protecting terminal protein Tpg n=1 Tax=Streptomyces sp. NBC_01221 TaxID=2903782 RepID=UPI002256B87B|nr:terminal protein TpgA1 [Streptomyces sp. NBC_01221]MCX4791868.1 terminal protein TpgA1 [Streptomyces sp. NBC_01221]
MGLIEDRLEEAVDTAYSQPIPKSIGARVRFLLKQEKGLSRADAARAVAEKLGKSQRTVERYRDDQIKTAKPDTAALIEAEVNKAWQPLVKAKKLQAAITSTGIKVDVRGKFGFKSPKGTTNDPRYRRLTRRLDADTARALYEAKQAGADEDELAQIIADGLRDDYFTDGGTRAQSLQQVALQQIDHIRFRLS